MEHCAICRWSELCSKRRRDDDDLSLVAGMTTGQRRALKAAGIATRRGFAAVTELPRLERVSRGALGRSQAQARLQVASEDEGTIQFRLLEPDRDADGALIPNRGLLALPEPADGDLFFDIERARYYSEDSREFGLQYLFGVVDTADLDEAGHPRTRRSGPSTGKGRSGRSRSSSTSSPNGALAGPGCTCTTTTTTSRRRSTISPSCTARGRRRWAG